MPRLESVQGYCYSFQERRNWGEGRQRELHQPGQNSAVQGQNGIEIFLSMTKTRAMDASLP